MLDLVPFGRKREIREMFRGMDELMNRVWHGFPERELEADFGAEWLPRMDVSETDREITVKAELPGLESKDIDITLDENFLVIKGERKQEKEESGKTWHRVEREYGTFYRSLRLPSSVDREKIDARCVNGELTIVLPKAEDERKITHVKVH